MNSKKNIILFCGIIFLFSALFVNYIIIKSFTIVDTNFISSLDAIYLEQQDLPPEISMKLSKLLNSNNQKIYKKLLEEISNPVSQFYGFCGYFRFNRILAVDYLKSGIIVSPKSVPVVYNGQRVEHTLGYAVVLLLRAAPEWLVPYLGVDFVNMTSDFVYSLYKQTLSEGESAYKQELAGLIQERYPKLAVAIVQELASSKNVSEMTEMEKQEVSAALGILDEKIRIKVMAQLLSDRNELVLTNTLNYISEETASQYEELIPVIENMLIRNNYKTDIMILLAEKFTSILGGKRALSRIRRVMMANYNNSKLLSRCLELFYLHADDNWWDFLTVYLNNSYPVTINNQALNTIIHVSWGSNPDNVYRTFVYVLKRSSWQTAKIAVEYYISHKLKSNQSVILSRFRLYENKEMKLLAVKYIESFGAVAGRDILIRLTGDRDNEVRKEADEALTRLKWSRQIQREPQSTAAAVVREGTVPSSTVPKQEDGETSVRTGKLDSLASGRDNSVQREGGEAGEGDSVPQKSQAQVSNDKGNEDEKVTGSKRQKENRWRKSREEGK